MPESPDAASAARRMICLEVFVFRAQMELSTLGGDQGGLHEAQQDLDEEILPWLHESGLWDSLSKYEQEMLPRPVGSWDQQDLVDATWRNEAIGVLAWALRMEDEIGPYDDQWTGGDAGPDDHKDHEAIISSAMLRPAEQISQARDVAEFWHWRTNMSELIDTEENDNVRAEYEKAVRDSTAILTMLGVQTLDQDVEAFGKPFRDLDDEEWSTVASIVVERHTALNWLCGYGDDWDEVPLDT